MTTNSKTKLNKKFIEKKIIALQIEKEAYNSGLYQGPIKILSMTNLLISFFAMALHGKNSYSIWAQFLSGQVQGTVSKVAIWKRVNNKNQVAFLQKVLENTFQVNLSTKYLNSSKQDSLFSPFSQVLLQDSTIISLPDELHGYFKGSISNGKQKSSIRLQAIYCLFTGCFRSFEIGSFTENDQSASKKIIKYLKPGYLVIRDLGYHVLNVLKKIASKKAYYLSRYHHATNIYDKVTNQEINLLKLFSKRKIIDTEVLVGKNEKLPCRLVAVKLPAHVAAGRKRKARNDRDKRLNHDKKYMKLLEWAIFITNVPLQIWDWKSIIKAYKIRWYIEIVFKGWKSHFNLTSLVPERPKKNRMMKKDLTRYKTRVESVIYMMLIFIVLFHIHIYTYWVFKIFHKHKKYISLLKLCNYIALHKERIFNSENIEELETEIAYFACYEKRKKRINSLEMIFDITEN
jgi:hypothetical protein